MGTTGSMGGDGRRMAQRGRGWRNGVDGGATVAAQRRNGVDGEGLEFSLVLLEVLSRRQPADLQLDGGVMSIHEERAVADE